MQSYIKSQMHFQDIFIFCFLFYLPRRSKVWIELLDLSDSLKYFIPSAEPISFPIPNIYSKKKKIKKMELIHNIYPILNIHF